MNILNVRFSKLFALAMLLPVFGASSLVLAQSKSTDRPIRIIVPFSPGGGTDTVARTLGAAMSLELGQNVIVENKPGAGTVIGTDSVAKSAPDVPTIAEAGVPGYAAESWYGFFVPAGTPAAIVNKLNAATAKAAKSEVFRKRVEGEGLVISGGTPKELADYVNAQQKRWAAVVKAANIQPN